MFGHFGTAEADDAAAGVEEAVVAFGIEQEEVAHDDVCEAFGKTANVVFEGFACTLGGELGVHGLIVGSHLAKDFAQGGELFAYGHSIIVGDAFEIAAIANAFGSSDDLQLRCTFVDAEDSSIAVEAFTGVFFHESAAAVDLDAVVGALVGVFTGHQFGERREAVGITQGGFHGLTLFGSEGADFGETVIAVGEVHLTCCLVEERTHGVGFGAHGVEDVLDGNHLVDGFTELFAGGSIVYGFAAGGFAETDSLGTDAETGTIHEGHGVFDKSQTTFANQLAGGVVEDEFGGGGADDTHFVFDAAHGETTVGTVVDEIREATAVGSAFFGAGKDEVDVGVAVGDETFDTVETPAVGGLVEGCFEAYRLEVGTCIGFGEIHAASGTFVDAGEVFVFNGFGSEILDGVGAVLEHPDGGKAYIGTGYNFACHGGDSARHVETVVFAALLDAVET